MAAYELYARTTHECLRPIVRRVREVPVGRFRPWVVGYCGVGGRRHYVDGRQPGSDRDAVAIFGGVLTCGLWCLLMVWTDHRFLPAPLRMGWPLRVINLISGVFLTGWGLRGAFDFFTG